MMMIGFLRALDSAVGWIRDLRTCKHWRISTIGMVTGHFSDLLGYQRIHEKQSTKDAEPPNDKDDCF